MGEFDQQYNPAVNVGELDIGKFLPDHIASAARDTLNPQLETLPQETEILPSKSSNFLSSFYNSVRNIVTNERRKIATVASAGALALGGAFGGIATAEAVTANTKTRNVTHKISRATALANMCVQEGFGSATTYYLFQTTPSPLSLTEPPSASELTLTAQITPLKTTVEENIHHIKLPRGNFCNGIFERIVKSWNVKETRGRNGYQQDSIVSTFKGNGRVDIKSKPVVELQTYSGCLDDGQEPMYGSVQVTELLSKKKGTPSYYQKNVNGSGTLPSTDQCLPNTRDLDRLGGNRTGKIIKLPLKRRTT